MKTSLKKLQGAVLATLLVSAGAHADFPNERQTPGELINHVGAQMGRLAIIDTLGDYVITIPEMPSSPAGSDFLVRAWDISDPNNPRVVATFGETTHPFLAHGTVKRNNELYIGGYPNDAIRLNADGSLSHVPWSGPDMHWNKSGLMHPWSAADWWSYGEVGGMGWLALDGVQTATWDHLGQTGVIGFPAFMGNLMIYGADQSKTGIASYDVSNPAGPVLLDNLNTPATHPTIKNNQWDNSPAPWGIGGYWSEISHHYMVFARREGNPGIQVVDFSDPSNLRLHCDFLVKDPKFGLGSGPSNDMDQADPMYVGFQDEYVFSERFKLNMETCEVALALDEISVGVETSQYARPIGNLVLTGGMENWMITNKNSAGMGIWAHQAEPDTRAPYVSYHIPKANQTNYPVMAPISLMIPETLRSETITVGDTVMVREVGGAEVAIDYLLSHTGMLTIDPLQNLKANTTYEVRLAGIQDAVRNEMEPYTFRFSTGSSISGGTAPPPTPAPTPPPASPTPIPQPTAVPQPTATPAPTAVPTVAPTQRPTPQPTPAPALNIGPVINSVSASPTTAIAGETVAFDVDAFDEDGDPLQYRFRVQGLTDYSAWGGSSNFNFVFESPGQYTVNVQARDDQGAQVAAVRSVSILDSRVEVPTGPSSGPMALSASENILWVVNPDNNTLTSVDTFGLQADFEMPTGAHPTGVAVAADGSVWVTAQRDDAVEIYNSIGMHEDTIELGYGSAPAAIVIDQNSGHAYVSLYGKGEVVRLNTATRAVTGTISTAYTVKALALSADGQRLLAGRFISGEHFGEVWDIDTGSFSLSRTIRLYPNLQDDTVTNGRGVPNYVSGIVINAEGTRAYVVSKKDNVARGLINGNEDLDDDNTIRTLAMTIDLTSGEELRNERVDFDNADSPSAVALAPNGNYLLVSMQGRNQVFAVSLDTQTERLGDVVAQFVTGLAPQGLVLDPQSSRLFVKNFTDRTVTAIELAAFLQSGSINPERSTLSTVENERLSPQVLRGKQLFYNAAEGILGDSLRGRMSAEGYISCASCHFDGGQDGRTYDFTGRGEGLRNNISLLGRSGTRFGNVHWSGNFDEIHDFENDIRNAFRGSGLMSDDDFARSADPMGAPKAGISEDLDALDAYVTSLGKDSLPKSPYRVNGQLTDSAQNGEWQFQELGCADCHRGKAFTDGAVHDVGTLRSYSGTRLGEELPGIKTPSLLGVFDTAPYLHDGSAASLADVFTSTGGTVIQAEDASLSRNAQVVEAEGFSYLRNGAGVALSRRGMIRVTISSESQGQGMVRVRVGSSSAGASLRIGANRSAQVVSLPQLDQVDGNDVAFVEVSRSVQLRRGTNYVNISLSSGSSVLVDDVTVSTPADLAKANVHTRVSALSSYERDSLIDYLQQLDYNSAPEDNELVDLGDWFDPNSFQKSIANDSASADSNAAPAQSSSSDDGANDDGASEDGAGSMGGGMLILLSALMLFNRTTGVFKVRK